MASYLAVGIPFSTRAESAGKLLPRRCGVPAWNIRRGAAGACGDTADSGWKHKRARLVSHDGAGRISGALSSFDWRV